MFVSVLLLFRSRGSLVVSLPSGPTPTGSAVGIGSDDAERILPELLETRVGLEEIPPLVTARIALRSSRTPLRYLTRSWSASRVSRSRFRAIIAAAFDSGTGRIGVFAFVVRVAEAVAPAPVRAQPLFRHLGSAREHDLRGAHIGRHHADQIVRAEDAVDQADERLGDGVRILEATCVVSRKITNTRWRGFSAACSISRWEEGSMRSDCGPAGRTTTCSKLSTFWATPSSAISKSVAARSTTGTPSGSDKRRRGRNWPRYERSGADQRAARTTPVWATGRRGLAPGTARPATRRFRVRRQRRWRLELWGARASCTARHRWPSESTPKAIGVKKTRPRRSAHHADAGDRADLTRLLDGRRLRPGSRRVPAARASRRR